MDEDDRVLVERVRRGTAVQTRSIRGPARPVVRALLGLLVGTVALRSDPSHARLPRDPLVENVARLGAARGSDAAAVPLLRVFDAWSTSDPERVFAVLAAVAEDTRHTSAVRSLARARLTMAYLLRDDAESAAASARALGHPTAWLVVGPFDNEGKAGFERVDPPEDERRGPIDLEARFDGKERPVSWRVMPDVAPYGWVSLAGVLRPRVNACGFATTFVRASRPGRARLWVGAAGAVRAYWNGDLAVTDGAYRGPGSDRVAAGVDLAGGWNRLLVKVCTSEALWGFAARLTRPGGEEIPGLEYSADPALAGSPPPDTRDPVTAPTILSGLEAAAAGGRREALLDLAWFLALDRGDDPVDRRVRQLALQATEGDADTEALLFASAVVDDRNERGRLVARAVEKDPTDFEALLAMARFRRAGARAEDALPWIERALSVSPSAPAALAERAFVERACGLPALASRTMTSALERSPHPAPATVRLTSDLARDAGFLEESERLLARSLDALATDTIARRRLAESARDRGWREEAMRHAQRLVTLSPDEPSNRVFLASIQESLGLGPEATRTLQEAIAILPDESSLHEELGRLLLRLGRNEEARRSLEAALALRPQEAELRQLLEHLNPMARPDEAYASDVRELLAAPRMPGTDDHPARFLRDLTVTTVFQNGLASRFRQVVIEVLTPEGAQSYQSFPIQYDPSGQRVEVRVARVVRRNGQVVETSDRADQSLSEPWYRLYYDFRALFVVFPRLSPGDAIEVQYRVDDVAHRNLFADYFGDVTFLQGTEPRANVEYVLIGPEARRFHFNSPRLPRLQRTESRDGDRQIIRFHAAVVGPVSIERGMPGLAEVAAYIHVSTYRTWEEVGRWYWGLVRDEFRVDDSLRATVRRLVEGAPNDLARARSIYDWVVENTRYVGLEFGIHGYKPYRTTQVVLRGYGDCKDKATLLVSMLEEAGIPATIVLVRTRRNGAIDLEPASLAIFDHAIAYVPSLDLYLDGTAEYSGASELPDQDQGVMVLHVNQGRPEVRTTPVLPPERNVSRRRVAARVDVSGGATLEVSVEVAGSAASALRERYGAEGTRRERLEQALGADYPGARLEQFRFDSVSREAPVSFHYEARVPEYGLGEEGGLTVPAAVPVDLSRRFARSSERVHDLEIGAPWTSEVDIDVTLPPGMRVRDVPEDVEVRGAFGAATLRVRVSGSSVNVEQRVSLTRERIRRGDYAAFRRFCQDVDAAFGERLSLGTGR